MKIFIIEDDQDHWTYIKYMLTRGEFSFYPQYKKDFLKIRTNFNKYFSPKILLQEEAEDFFRDTFSPDDILLLDYELNEFNRKINCVDLYMELKLTQKALIYTKVGLDDINDIKNSLGKASLDDRILVSQKPTSFPDTHKARKNIISLSNKINEVIALNPKNHQIDRKGREINKTLPIVVILTAILEEYNAVKAQLDDVQNDTRQGTSYETGIFKMDQKDIAIVKIRECGQTNSVASQEAERAIHNFDPDCMFFVGIAASRKPIDFNIGDVIFPEKIYAYEGGKEDRNAFSARPDVQSATYDLFELAKVERRATDWYKLINKFKDREPKANLGVIASGEKLIENYNSHVGNILTKYYNDTSAVEMEGFGFAQAISKQGRERRKILFGVVRGISDILKETIGSVVQTPEDDRRPSDNKVIASDTSAAFTFWLIYKLFGS